MYAEVATTTFAAVRDAILDFADDLGWTVGASALTRPGGGLTGTFSISTYELKLAMTVDAVERSANVRRPWNMGIFKTPTRTFLFGDDTPGHFIGVVVEFGFNCYRHLYIGNMIKAGAYTGGEVIAANCARDHNGGTTNNSFSNANDAQQCYLFSARAYHNNGNSTFDGRTEPQGNTFNRAGGVNIVHADNPKPWRRFMGPGGNGPYLNFTGDEAFGGMQDGFLNADLHWNGVSEFAGAAVLVPINLFVPQGASGADFRVRPIGTVAGPMACNMQNLSPEQEILIGTQTWKAFPEFGRYPLNETPMFADVPGNRYGTRYDNSNFVGIAYPKD